MVADIGFSLRCNAGLGVSDAEQRNGRRVKEIEKNLYRFYGDIRTRYACRKRRQIVATRIIFLGRAVTGDDLPEGPFAI